MLSRLRKFSIVQKILAIYIINIFIFLMYILYSYSFTENSINNLKKIVKEELPISQIHNKNYELLDDIITIFRDTVLTNELDSLIHANEKKDLILNNLNKIYRYSSPLNLKKQKKLFLDYYKFAYSFTTKILINGESHDLEDMIKLQKLSKKTIKYFEMQKESSLNILVYSLEKISTKTGEYFYIALILAIFGLLLMTVSSISTYSMLQHRFIKVIKSIKSLAVSQSDFSNRLEVEYDDELGEIVKWFNKLQSKLEIDYNQLNKLKKETEQSLEKEIEDTQKEVVFTMGAIAESRSKETGNHVRRVAEYSKILALYSGIDERNAELLRQASPMHDIGKVAIPDHILNKPGKHTYEEFEIMKTHSLLGYEMLKHSNRPLLQMASHVAYGHHEKWDGSGYPLGLKGEDINIYARITAIADVFDALGSDRAYKKAWDDERIFSLFREERGKHFDPFLVDLFFENIDEFLVVRDKFKDTF